MSTQPSLNPTFGGRTLNEGATNTNNQSSGAVTATRPLPSQRKMVSAHTLAIHHRISAIEDHLKGLKAELFAFSAAPMPMYQDEPTSEEIIACVARQYGVRTDALFAKCNAPRNTEPRRMAQYLMRTHKRMGLPSIGRYFRQHHTTVLHACQMFLRDVADDATTRGRLAIVEKYLQVRETTVGAQR